MVEALQAATTIAESKEESHSRRGSKLLDDEHEPTWNDAKIMLAEVANNDQIDSSITLKHGELVTTSPDEGGDNQSYDEDFEDEDGADTKEDDNVNSLEYSKTQRRLSEGRAFVRGDYDNNEGISALEGTTKIKRPDLRKEFGKC